jgi:hypothetical protein
MKNYWLDKRKYLKVGEEVMAVVGVPFGYLGSYCIIKDVKPFFAQSESDKRSYPDVNAFYYIEFGDGFKMSVPSTWITKL